MGEYATVSCSACHQGLYLPTRVFSTPTWRCPSCGAENSSADRKPPVDLGLAAPSRFGSRSNGNGASSSNGHASRTTVEKRSIWSRLVS